MHKKGNEISPGESPDIRRLPTFFNTTSEHIQYFGKYGKQYLDNVRGKALFKIC